MSSLFNTLKQLAVAANVQGEDMKIQFSMRPEAGESGFAQWREAMKMVSRLSGGIPHEFRRTLWLTLAERHIALKNINWSQIEETCFNNSTNSDDEELGVQIVKDLHRTGCSLFCGSSGEENQAVLKRVLLAYARWNKLVGYCQGFNMLAALILEVMDRCEYNSLKIMIYLIEGVLPESYFANSLQGLSIDMAVFRDLLRIKLPQLSRHLEQLQVRSNDVGNIYEPPLTNVFTMQWFLTLFCNYLPHSTVLRVWDLIFLEGNSVLLKTALAIWGTLSDRIMAVKSADEFYSIMGVLMREMLEFGLMDANSLIKTTTNIELAALTELRERYTYNITPWSEVARRGLRLFYGDDESDDSDDSVNDVRGVDGPYGFLKATTRHGSQSIQSISPPSILGPFSSDKEKVASDVFALKKQYSKLKERQSRAQIIFTAACHSQNFMSPIVSSTPPPVINHLMLSSNSDSAKLTRAKNNITIPVWRDVQRLKGISSVPQGIRGETVYWNECKKKKRKRSYEEIVAPNSAKQGCDSHPNDEFNSPTVDDSDSSSSMSSHLSFKSSSSSSSTELCDEIMDIDSEDANTSSSECLSSPRRRIYSFNTSLAEVHLQHDSALDKYEVSTIKQESPVERSACISSDYYDMSSRYKYDKDRILNVLLTTSLIASEQLNKQGKKVSISKRINVVDIAEVNITEGEDASEKHLNHFIGNINKISRSLSDSASIEDIEYPLACKIIDESSMDTNTKNLIDILPLISRYSCKNEEWESALEHMKINALAILFSTSTLQNIRNDSGYGEVAESDQSPSVITNSSVKFYEECELELEKIMQQNMELLRKVNRNSTSLHLNINVGEHVNIEENDVNYYSKDNNRRTDEIESIFEESKKQSELSRLSNPFNESNDSLTDFVNFSDKSNEFDSYVLIENNRIPKTYKLSSFPMMNILKMESDGPPSQFKKRKHKSWENLNTKTKSKLKIGLIGEQNKWISLSIDNFDIVAIDNENKCIGTFKSRAIKDSNDNEEISFLRKKELDRCCDETTAFPDPFLHINYGVIATGKKNKGSHDEYSNRKHFLSQSYQSTELNDSTFSPFPLKSKSRPPKELGLKLGLYSSKQ